MVCFVLCVGGRDLDGTAQSLKGVESEKEELSSLTIMLQKSIEVQKKPKHFTRSKKKKALCHSSTDTLLLGLSDENNLLMSWKGLWSSIQIM